MTRVGDFSKDTKRQALKRAKGTCEAVGTRFGLPKGYPCNNSLSYGVRFEHSDPEANSHNGTLENCLCVCVSCWRHKTDSYDKPLIAKTVRQRDKHLGIKARSTFPKRVNAWSRT